MLRITVYYTPSSLTFLLEGNLVGPWADEVEKCWRDTLASQRRSVLYVDLTGVTSIDTRGKTCLSNLHQQGAEFITADILMKAVVDEIIQTPARQNHAGSECLSSTER